MAFNIYEMDPWRLEGENSNIMVIDVGVDSPTRVINIYRSFSPQNGVSQRAKCTWYFLTSSFFENELQFGNRLRHN